MESRIVLPFSARVAALGAATAVLLTLLVAIAPVSPAAPSSTAAGTTASSSVSAMASPTAAGWINGMNKILDKSGSFFIADYGDPGYYDWSSDNCSWSPDNNPYGFKWACRRHDYGYRNLKRGDDRYPNHVMWNRKNKAVVDRQFHEDLYTHCRVEHDNSSGCRNAADTYHGIVSRTSPNTVGMDRHTLYLF